ncbi:MAG: hypothetical protein K6F99_04020 [Lachnospiraceae bacterium]|nr:hypothetical protein [Lachnospiraceae bacterium]
MGGSGNILSILLETIKSRFASIVSNLKLYTSWAFIKARIIIKIRDFFYSLLDVRPKNKNDYFPVFGWLVSKRLAYMLVVVVGVISLFYITSETKLFSRFGTNGGIRTYKYDSFRLRLANEKVQITGKSGYLAYEGNVSKGAVQGAGTLYNLSGNVVYTGNFENSKYEGVGTLNYGNGNLRYNGSFHENLFSGTGNLFRDDGTTEYVGEFSQGQKNGTGVLYDGGGNELFNGKFASDEIVYGELLGKTAPEVVAMYKGKEVFYTYEDSNIVYMPGINAIYEAVGDGEAVDDSAKVQAVYVLQNSLPYGNNRLRKISDIASVMGNPIYEGNSKVVLPEVIAINTLNETGNTENSRIEMDVEPMFSDAFTVNGFDNEYSVYIYSFKRGEQIYSFVCNGQSDNFDCYYITKAGEA